MDKAKEINILVQDIINCVSKAYDDGRIPRKYEIRRIIRGCLMDWTETPVTKKERKKERILIELEGDTVILADEITFCDLSWNDDKTVYTLRIHYFLDGVENRYREELCVKHGDNIEAKIESIKRNMETVRNLMKKVNPEYVRVPRYGDTDEFIRKEEMK